MQFYNFLYRGKQSIELHKILIMCKIINKMIDDINQYLKDLSDAKKTPTTKEFPFDLISKRISFLIKACEILDKHPEDLEKSYRKEIEKRKIPASAMLVDFILLDINTFYSLAEKRFEGIIPPSTRKPVSRFRHNVLGHFQKQNNKGVVEEYIIINKIGFHKIRDEFYKFRDDIFKIINKP